MVSVSKSLDLDQTQHFVGPDLGPNCLPRLSANNIVAGEEFSKRIRFKESIKYKSREKKRF